MSQLCTSENKEGDKHCLVWPVLGVLLCAPPTRDCGLLNPHPCIPTGGQSLVPALLHAGSRGEAWRGKPGPQAMTTNLILATRPATSIFRSHVAWTGWGMGMECHHPPPHPPAASAWGLQRSLWRKGSRPPTKGKSLRASLP